jgi:hypothetical protein
MRACNSSGDCSARSNCGTKSVGESAFAFLPRLTFAIVAATMPERRSARSSGPAPRCSVA